MDIRPFSRFLALLLIFPASLSYSQEERDEFNPLDEIVAPDIERREIREPDIDSENWEVGIFGGIMSIEDFGSNTVSGARLTYHISENWFTEASYGAAEAGETSFELLSGATQILTDDQRQLAYYDMSVGYNLFQGEVFLGRNRAFNSNLYLTLGAGNTDFADDSYFTYSLGMGGQFFLTDWFSIQTRIKAYSFSHELLGEEKAIINLEPQVGMTFFF